MICGALLLVAVQGHAQDQIVAIVNKDVVTEKDLYDFTNFMRMQLSREYHGSELEARIEKMIPELLEKLIEDKLILQEAKKAGVTVEESAVDGRIDEIKKQFGNETVFRADLRRQGLVEADLRRRIREQMLAYTMIEQEIRSRVLIAPEEVTRFYEEHPDDFRISQERQVDSVTVRRESDAEAIADELKAGRSLEEIEAAYREVTVSALNVVKGRNVREDIEDIIYSLDEGGVSDPLPVENKFYIFRLNRIIPPRKLELTEVQDRISFYLRHTKTEQRIEKWLAELKDKAYIKILEPR